MNVPLSPIRFKHRAERLFGGKTAVVCGPDRFTYAEFARRCDRLSHALQSLGVLQGDRVAYLVYNCHRLLEAYYGVVQMGGILMPINIRVSSREMVHILNEAKAKVLFFDGDFQKTIAAILPELTSVKYFVQCEGDRRDPWILDRSYEDLLEGASGEPFAWTEPDENDVAEIFYTSGTTAAPRGVMLTHRNLYLHALTAIIAIGAASSDRQLHTIPLFHVNGWGVPQSLTCMGGAHIMLKRFMPAEVLSMIEQEQVTVMALVPTMANALLNEASLGSHDYSSLRLITLGGAAPSVEMIGRMESAFRCLCITGYGLTETSPILTLATHKVPPADLGTEERIRRQATTGWPVVGVEIRVVRDDGSEINPDGREIGEILARGDGVMKGYWEDEEATQRVLRDGWFHTGDMATLDSEGYLLIVDRKKDIIISGGENIASIEIENCIHSHPAVFECAVIPVPDPQWGEVPKALVVLKPGSMVDAEELLNHCRRHLASFKCPRSFEFFSDLPKGGTGKILKRTLRERYWEGQERRVQG